MRQRIRQYLREQQQQCLLRSRSIANNSFIDFSSNDYLCLSKHPKIVQAMKEGSDRYGVGSGGSTFICGYTSAHQEAEEKFAGFLGREKALLFASGYQANLGVITSLASRGSTVLLDKLSHASIIDGTILSRACLKRYPHNNIHAFRGHASNKQTIVCTEGVFSMEGNITDIKSIADFSKKNKAVFILDDAHAFSVISPRGSIEFHGLKNSDVSVLINPLGKAIGVMGAIVSGSKDYMEYILQRARSLKYSTSISPAIACAISKSLDILTQEHWRFHKLQSISACFVEESYKRGISLVSDDVTAVKSIVVPKISDLLNIEQSLLQEGIVVSIIRPPSVPKDNSRIRVSLNVSHGKEDIIKLLDKLQILVKS